MFTFLHNCLLLWLLCIRFDRNIVSISVQTFCFLIPTFCRPGPALSAGCPGCDGIIWPFIWVWSHLWVFTQSPLSLLTQRYIQLISNSKARSGFLIQRFKVNTFKNNADQILFNHKEAGIILILIETEKDCKIKIEHYVQPFWILIILAGEGRGESLYLIYFLPSLINFCYDNFAIPWHHDSITNPQQAVKDYFK